jgi:hypothetical protein
MSMGSCTSKRSQQAFGQYVMQKLLPSWQRMFNPRHGIHAHLACHAECVAQLCLAASEFSCITVLMALRHDHLLMMTCSLLIMA